VGLGAPKPLELVEGFVPLRDRVRGVGNDAAPIGLGGIEVPLSPRCSRRWVPAQPSGKDEAEDQAWATVDREPGAR
jgi:hypothetical protein